MTTFIKKKQKKSHIEKLQILQDIKIVLHKNHHSKIHDDKAIISCKNICQNVKNKHV